jgi:hypothetical protein
MSSLLGRRNEAEKLQGEAISAGFQDSALTIPSALLGRQGHEYRGGRHQPGNNILNTPTAPIIQESRPNYHRPLVGG